MPHATPVLVMHLLLLRHAPADASVPDAGRALTVPGRALAVRVATGLQTALPGWAQAGGGWEPVQIVSSPLVRARETAAILADALGIDTTALAQWPALAPGGGGALWPPVQAAADARGGEFTLALVGHSPDLELFAGAAVGSSGAKRIYLDKAGACLIRFIASPAPGTGTLVWLKNPT